MLHDLYSVWNLTAFFQEYRKKSLIQVACNSVNCCLSSLIQSLLNQKKNTSTFLLLGEKRKKVTTSSYNIGISDAHKYVLRGLCWMEAGPKYLQLLTKMFSYYGKTKIALKVF